MLHLAPRPGTNAAVMLGIAHVVARDGFVEHDFVDARTQGYEEVEALLALYTPEHVEEITGHPSRRHRSGRAHLRRGDRGVRAVARGDRAQVRLGGRAVDLQSRDDDREGRAAWFGAVAVAWSEQCPGLF